MNCRAGFQRVRGKDVATFEMRRGQAGGPEGVSSLHTCNVPNVSSPTPASGFRTLLVPLDGSSLAEHALPRALAIARRSGASIRLAHVYSPLASADDPWRLYSRHFLADVDQQRVGEKQRYLNDVVRRIALRDSVRVVTFLSESERVAEQLSAAAQGVDLVVMATHAWGRLGRLWHGSTADALIRKARSPLLLVRGYSSPVDLTGDPIARKVLVPLDGSSFSEHILPHAAAIGQISSAAVTLLYVERSEQLNPHIPKGHALGYLRRMAESLKDHLGTVSTQIVRTDERAPEAVLAFAAEQNVDLVAVTTHAGGGLLRFTRNRIAEAVLQRAGTAVLILRPKTHTRKES